jgi:small subunit ribosomal protein S6
MATLQSLRDAPNTAREYETVFILAPETPNEEVAKVNDRVKGVIQAMGGSVLKVDNWGKRRLAYEIKKQLKGIYLHWQYLGSAGLVEELERNLRMLDLVLRYMTVKVDANIDPNARPSEMDDDAYARAAETAADEEDIMIGAGGSSLDDDDDEYGGGDYDSDDDDDYIGRRGDDDDNSSDDGYIGPRRGEDDDNE